MIDEMEERDANREPPPSPYIPDTTILFSQKADNLRNQTLKGKKLETQTLGMHLKPPTAYFLDVLISCRCLSAETL